MGGEKLVVPFPRHRAGGSPPRGRGKVPEAGRPGADEGITPAWAGKRLYCHPFWKQHQDHPRTGGEKLFRLPLFQSPLGSPPHRRGKEIDRLHKAINNRITPAWAGKSAPVVWAGVLSGDHPRVGGEKHHPTPSTAALRGSPPRGRGKGWFPDPAHWSKGITPAWAGKSSGGRPGKRARRDHPRVGGEKLRMGFLRGLVLGSPPRGRGKGSCHHGVILVNGITPAWAGKRFSELQASHFHQGSPPRGRGKAPQ